MGSIRRSKTKRRTRDLDQIHADLKSAKHLAEHKASKAAEDLPGLGQWYCTECAKWFEGEHNLLQHRRGKNHKRRVRLLKEEPHSQKAAEAAVGLYTDNGKGREQGTIRTLSEQTPMEIEAS
ncbi:Bud site selection protein 20 [Trapelia coarctata]|nr:Bud site selection protein 20 [Trapelia coarctata]